MKVTVLGGSAAGGNPGQGCSGYLFSSPSTNLVVDLGPGTLLELRKHADFRTIDAVIITHMHVDHYLDLAALRYSLAYNPQKIDRKVPLLLPPGGKNHLEAIGTALSTGTNDDPFFASCFEISEFNPSAEINAGDFRIGFEATIHYIPTWAVRVSTESGKSIGYSADTGPCKALVSFFSGVDALVCEATFVTKQEEGSPRLHLTASEAGQLASESGVGQLLLTHSWAEFGTEPYLVAARTTYTGPVLLAKPGLTVVVE